MATASPEVTPHGPGPCRAPVAVVSVARRIRPWLYRLLPFLPRRWSARRFGQTVVGPVALYVFLAGVLLSPLAFYQMPDSPAQDLANHVSGIIEARNAFAEGQFPLRVAPNQVEGWRY